MIATSHESVYLMLEIGFLLFLFSRNQKWGGGEEVGRTRWKWSGRVKSWRGLQRGIDRTWGSVSAFQATMLIISWHEACDLFVYVYVCTDIV